MPNKNYIKGYNFQQRVKKYMAKLGWNVIVRPRSAFPDLHCWKKDPLYGTELYMIIEIECKTNKYLSKEEKEKVNALKKQGTIIYLAWKDKKRKMNIDEI
jgi:Holliday junction resolvase